MFAKLTTLHCAVTAATVQTQQVQIIVHYAFLIGTGRLLKLPYRELLLASNANVGGPTTAAAMAASKQWKTLVRSTSVNVFVHVCVPVIMKAACGYVLLHFCSQ
jgi:uncharacterized membrane protein